MQGVAQKRLPLWPMRLGLSLTLLLEALFVVMLATEGAAKNAMMIVDSIGIIISCLLVWRALAWGRWVLIAFLAWRVASIGISAAAHFGPGDHRLPGSLILVTFYLVVAAMAASPLGRMRTSASAPRARP